MRRGTLYLEAGSEGVRDFLRAGRVAIRLSFPACPRWAGEEAHAGECRLSESFADVNGTGKRWPARAQKSLTAIRCAWELTGIMVRSESVRVLRTARSPEPSFTTRSIVGFAPGSVGSKR